MEQFKVLDVNEFSDHCPLDYMMNCNITEKSANVNNTYDKVIWDNNCDPNAISNLLETSFKFSSFLFESRPSQGM